jgi:hypothetical protein
MENLFTSESNSSGSSARIWHARGRRHTVLIQPGLKYSSRSGLSFVWPAGRELEVALSRLVTGNSYWSLQHSFRVSKPTTSNFQPKNMICNLQQRKGLYSGIFWIVL